MGIETVGIAADDMADLLARRRQAAVVQRPADGTDPIEQAALGQQHGDEEQLAEPAEDLRAQHASNHVAQ